MKKDSTSQKSMDAKIAELRSRIDAHDRAMIRILAERRDIAKQIAQLKINSEIDLWVADRVQEIVETRVAWAKKENLDTEFIEKFFRDLIDSNMKFEERMLHRQRTS